MQNENPKIIHRIYFTNFAPFHDPYERFLESWYREMPDYKIMLWGKDNLDVDQIEWTRRAAEDKQPVFLSEYFRWKILAQYGGLYLDADCEIVDGLTLHNLLNELYSQEKYDNFFGVEERGNGYPTAQTFAAKTGDDLVQYMIDLYENRLAPLWQWRETRALIGPQLISTYFLNKKINEASAGYFVNLDKPVIKNRSKIYPQKYFSPKFTIVGDKIDYEQGKTCVYHMFANANVDFSGNERLSQERHRALTFAEYRSELERALAFPRVFDARSLSPGCGTYEGGRVISHDDGVVSFGPYTTMPVGKYHANWYFSSLPGWGYLTLSVTSNFTKKKIASVKIDLNGCANRVLGVEFEIKKEAEHNVEFSVHTAGSAGAGPVSLERIIVNMAHSNQVRPSKRGSLKLLHRVYFGFDGKPDQFPAYLKTWEKELPDFEIKHWNAQNLPMDINPYVKQLYKERDHAFLTDFFRWYLLREYGGTYLDADVEVVNGKTYAALIAKLEASSEYDAFIGIDEKGGGWYTAHSMASKPGSDISKFMCELYENFGSFTAWRKQGLYFWAPQLVGLYFSNRGYNVDGMGTAPHLTEPTVRGGVKIYPQDWFSPLAPTGNPAQPFILNALTDNTSLCHHFACSWHDSSSIYLQHSQSKGGQANVLLRDLTSPPSSQSFKYPADLASEVGVTHGDFIITSGMEGCLVFTKAISLSTGKYAAAVELHEIVALNEVRVAIASASRPEPVKEYSVDATNIVDGALVVQFDLPTPQDITVKIFVGPESVLAVKAIHLRSVS